MEQISTNRYGFRVKVKESQCKAPENIRKCIDECRKSIKVLEDVWFSRADCKSLKVTQNVSMGIFILWHLIDTNEENDTIKNKIQEILDNDIVKDIHVPRGADVPTGENVKKAKESIVENLKEIYFYYKGQVIRE
jgi:uncharacterized protein (UPF0147 family)